MIVAGSGFTSEWRAKSPQDQGERVITEGKIFVKFEYVLVYTECAKIIY